MSEPAWDGVYWGTVFEGWVTDVADPRFDVLWPGAVEYAADYVNFVLHCAAVQCSRFAPPIPITDPPTPVPPNYVAAQIMQARALVRAGIASSGDQLGGYGDTVTVFPMDWQVKNLLRPKRGRPYFGGRRVVP